MGSLGGLEIGLSFMFGVILLGLVAELYYFLWWKRRLSNGENEAYAPLLSYFLCRKAHNSILNSNNRQELNPTVPRNREINDNEQDVELGSSKDSLLKGLGEENVDLELMRLHNLCGPPRFLFTIKEETKEDLESDDAKSRGERSRKGSRNRSLSDILIAVDTPFLTPLASPTLKSSPLGAYRGFNPLFESFTEADLNQLISSSPPKLKFLRDAEEKLIRRLVEEAERRALKNGGSDQDSGLKSTRNSEEKVGMNWTTEREIHQQEGILHPSGPSKVLPLAASPSTIRPIVKKYCSQ